MKRIFLFITLVFPVGFVNAEPLYIEFWEMLEESKMIVIANSVIPLDNKDASLAQTYEINVISVLKGKQFTGKYKVRKAQGNIHIPPNMPFVAFINQENGFEWYGLPIDEKTTILKDNSILSLAGFYDFNAYLVSPSTITLAQLKQYLKERKYSIQVNGHLYCFSNASKQLESTQVQLSVNYTYTKNGINAKANVNGLTWKDFPTNPEVEISAWDNEIDLNFETNGYRAFTIKGEILPQPDSNGTLQAKFWVTDPQELNFDELNEYLLNDIHGFPSYELEVIIDKNIYPLILGEEIGRIGVFSYEGKKLGISSYNVDAYWPREIIMEYNYYEKLVISLDTTAVTKDQLGFTNEKMVRELKVNPIKGKLLIRNDKDQDRLIANCELRYVATRFTKNINYGKN